MTAAEARWVIELTVSGGATTGRTTLDAFIAEHEHRTNPYGGRVRWGGWDWSAGEGPMSTTRMVDTYEQTHQLALV